MPVDRIADSYAIYSQLLPSGEKGKILYMIEDTTTSIVAADKACRPDANDQDENFYQNPHSAIKAPRGRQADLEDLLADFDRHCHETVRLTRDGFEAGLLIKLLTAAEGKHFQAEVISPKSHTLLARDYPNASGLLSFGEVYFNEGHTMAMVHSGLWCGLLCGTWKWIVLERTDGKWHELNWPISVTVS